MTATAGGASDLIIVKGETTIDEDTKVLVDAVGSDFTYGTRYTILTSEGGIDGTFGDVVSDLAFLTPTLSYDDTKVYLMLNRNDVSFASIGATRNQRPSAARSKRAGRAGRSMTTSWCRPPKRRSGRSTCSPAKRTLRSARCCSARTRW